jgi:DNA polymerase delta subunit 2
MFLINIAGCYPFQAHDPFILQACPHLFFIGNQSRFKSIVVESEPPPFRLNGPDTEMSNTGDDDEKPPTRVRLISIPKFHQTGELVLVDSETLEVEVVNFQVFSGKEELK